MTDYPTGNGTSAMHPYGQPEYEDLYYVLEAHRAMTTPQPPAKRHRGSASHRAPGPSVSPALKFLAAFLVTLVLLQAAPLAVVLTVVFGVLLVAWALCFASRQLDRLDAAGRTVARSPYLSYTTLAEVERYFDSETRAHGRCTSCRMTDGPVLDIVSGVVELCFWCTESLALARHIEDQR